MFTGFEKVIEARIKKAQEEGAFENLPGSGQPLHLEDDRPDIADQFLRFLETEALQADALYILGDLFESWVGDDDPNEHYQWIKQALYKLTKKGLPVYFMHGNRDFMIGEAFAGETGVTILPDPHVATIHGDQVLLSHGDAY